MDFLDTLRQCFAIAEREKFLEFKVSLMFGSPKRAEAFFDYAYQIEHPTKDSTLSRHQYNLSAEELLAELDKFIIRPYASLPLTEDQEEDDLDL